VGVAIIAEQTIDEDEADDESNDDESGLPPAEPTTLLEVAAPAATTRS